MKYAGWFLGVLTVFYGSLNLAPPTALAAETAANNGFNIVTSPLPIKLSTQPGRTVTAELRVKNQGVNPEVIKVGLMKFGATGEIGQPNLFDLTEKDEYAKWVSFSPSQFTAPPNVWVTVKMTIEVPPSASLGYYLAVTFSRASQPDKPETTNVRGSAATLVLLDVRSPNEKRQLELVEFTADKKLYEYLPVTFKVKVKNKGNIYLAPTGNIFITKGETPVTTINFNEIGGSVLPDSNRLYQLPWDSGFPVFKDRIANEKPVVDDKGVVQKDLRWDFSDVSKFRYGKYTAKLLVVYDDGKQDVPLESTLSFWVLPYKAMFVGLLVLGLIGLGVFIALRSVLRKTRQITKPRSRS